MNTRILSMALGFGIVALAATLSLAAPLLETKIAHDHTVFNDTNSVTKTVNNYPAKAIGYTYNVGTAASNTCTITLTRIKTLVNRAASGPVVLIWTNTHVLATLNLTNTASAIHTGTITDTLYTEKNDSITYTNTVVDDGVLTIQWEY